MPKKQKGLSVKGGKMVINNKPYPTYPGGKEVDGTYQTLINMIPPHDYFVSGFLGNCAVMRHKKPAPLDNIGVDIDFDVIRSWHENKPSWLALKCDDVIDFLGKKYFNNEGTFIYLDPPYPINSRKTKAKIYRFEMSDEQHVQLLKNIKGLKANVMISTYDNPIYKKGLERWNKVQFQSKTRRGMATETVYMNYALPHRLHDYSFLGLNFTDRQRIKRKVERHVNKLRSLPNLERNAIIEKVNNHFPDA